MLNECKLTASIKPILPHKHIEAVATLSLNSEYLVHKLNSLKFRRIFRAILTRWFVFIQNKLPHLI